MIVIIRALVALLLALTFAGPAHAYQCKSSMVTGQGEHKQKFKAAGKARNVWTAVAKHQFGLAWSVYSISAKKRMKCSKSRRVGGDKWLCLASARPCLYAVQ